MRYACEAESSACSCMAVLDEQWVVMKGTRSSLFDARHAAHACDSTLDRTVMKSDCPSRESLGRRTAQRLLFAAHLATDYDAAVTIVSAMHALSVGAPRLFGHTALEKTPTGHEAAQLRIRRSCPLVWHKLSSDLICTTACLAKNT